MRDAGLSPAALVTGLAALLAAGVSMGLALGTEKPSDSAGAGRSDRQELTASYARLSERVEGPVRTLAPAGDPAGRDIGTSSAMCPSGKRVTSGGYQAITGGGEIFYNDALAKGRVGWAIGASNRLARSGMVQAIAYCTQSGRSRSAAGRSLPRQRAAAARELEAVVNRYKAIRLSQRSALGGL